jgi:HK97 gp10 family phage protein
MSFQMQGLENLMQQIEQMGRALDGQTKEKALKESAEIMKEEVVANAREKTGTLKENIIVSDVQGEEVHVGPDQQGTAFYGHILEFGRKPGKKNGRSYPGAPAYPFMGPAFENKKEAVEEKMADVIKRELGL